jgi:acyl-CoA thioester hydrolase
VSPLDDATCAAFGVEPGWWFGIRHRVRWSEVDGFGHANHAAYLEWCEEARNRYLEALGLPPLSLTSPGPVLRRLEMDYRKPLAYPAEILVTARTRTLRRTSWTMHYAVWHAGLAATGTALCVLILNATGERVALPSSLREAMIARDGAHPE